MKTLITGAATHIVAALSLVTASIGYLFFKKQKKAKVTCKDLYQQDDIDFFNY